MTSRKGFVHLLVLLVILAIVIAFGVVFLNSKKSASTSLTTVLPTTTAEQLPPEVDNTSLYYIGGDYKLYKKSPLSSPATVFLDKVGSYAFSPDRTKIAFIKGRGQETDNNIYIKNLESRKIEVNIDCKPWCVNRSISWSPEGTYILVDSGTGTEGTLTVYQASNGKELSQFGDGFIVWLNETTVYMTYRTEVDPPREWGSGEGRSVAKVDITTGKTEILTKADATKDYNVNNIQGSCLYYSASFIDTNSGPLDSIYCYDLVTKATKTVPLDQVNAEYNKRAETEEKAIVQIVSEYATDKSTRVIRNNNFKDWIIVGVYKSGTSIYSSEIIIFNLSDPKGTFQKLGTGAQVDWY